MNNKNSKTPLVSLIVNAIKKRFYGKAAFTTSDKYWKDRYAKGGNSGTGSYNNLAEFKAEVINDFVAKNNISSVMEFGCGDGNQLKYFNFQNYIGYDVSPEAISMCSKIFKNDSTKQFKLLDSFKNEFVDLTMSLDVIYHLVEDDNFTDYMEKLFNSSNKYVIVYSSNADDHENNGISPHVKHRKFTTWVETNATEFEQIKFIPNRFPYNGNGEISSYADFFIFRKKNK